MTHLDTLVTFLQLLCPTLDVTRMSEDEKESRGRLSHHIISQSGANHIISLPLVKNLKCVRECLLNIWDFFMVLCNKN